MRGAGGLPIQDFVTLPTPLSWRSGPAGLPPPRDYAALVARIEAAGQPPLSWRAYGRQRVPAGPDGYDLLLAHVPAAVGATGRPTGSGRGAPLRVLLSGGTHGDEPAGVEALVRFLEQRRHQRWPRVAFTLMPCVNPWGYVHHRREGPAGRDLNRSFRRAGRATPEVTALKRALGRQHFDLFVDCHEDVDAPGLYVHAPPALGRTVVAAAGAIGPVHPGALVDDTIPLQQGVVEGGSEAMRELQRTWRHWPLPFYISAHHLRAAPTAGGGGPALGDEGGPDPAGGAEVAWVVVETPTRLPLDQRVAMHLAAVEAAVAAIVAPLRGQESGTDPGHRYDPRNRRRPVNSAGNAAGSRGHRPPEGADWRP